MLFLTRRASHANLYCPGSVQVVPRSDPGPRYDVLGLPWGLPGQPKDVSVGLSPLSPSLPGGLAMPSASSLGGSGGANVLLTRRASHANLSCLHRALGRPRAMVGNPRAAQEIPRAALGRARRTHTAELILARRAGRCGCALPFQDSHSRQSLLLKRCSHHALGCPKTTLGHPGAALGKAQANRRASQGNSPCRAHPCQEGSPFRVHPRQEGREVRICSLSP